MRDQANRMRALISSSLLLTCTAPVVWAQDLYLVDARIVDPAEQRIEHANLLIEDGVIVGTREEAPGGFAGRTVDLNGRWLIPGLNDLHTHSYGNMGPGNAFEAPGTATVAKRMLYAGVTGFLDLFGNEEGMYALRERQRRGAAGGADLYTSLSCLTATEGHCTEYGVPTRTIDTPDDARRVVADLAERAPDVVKIVYSPTGRMPSIDKATLAAAIAAARERDLRTVIHINTWDDVRDAVESGASAVTHVPAQPISDDVARLMAEHGVYTIPTLAVETELRDFVTDPTVLDNALAVDLTTSGIINAYRSEEMRQRALDNAQHDMQQTSTILSSVKAMSDAGVTVLTGTDSGNWGTIQGYSLHRELVKLVAAGLSPWQALAASTTNAGEFLGRSFGVRPGDEANLVVLDASPIDDIRNTQQIYMVIHHGVIVDRAQLLAPASRP